MTTSYGIHWFRRDLRVDGNPALRKNFEVNEGRVLGLFFLDPGILSRDDFSHSRFSFFLDSLSALREDFRERGGDLLVMKSSPGDGWTKLLNRLKREKAALPKTISWNRDYEPYAIQRDREVTQIVEGSLGISPMVERDHLIIVPQELKKDEKGGTYQIYSPFARKWFDLFKKKEIQLSIHEQNLPIRGSFKLSWKKAFHGKIPYDDVLESFREKQSKQVKIRIPEAGSKRALHLLDQFQDRITDYTQRRDLPALPGTSGLSIFLKNGSLTSAQVIESLQLSKLRFQGREESVPGPVQFLKEIVWREFYYHILVHHPRVEKEAFIEKYRDLSWENNKELFDAWKEGRTGFPIVDAGMRQLKQTGWMHNRVRMIVASFLTKDLLIDWRWGERYFMNTLLDGDLAPNNGGWQWAASTGCDPQPYFRIFNPTLQARRFDPEGVYIKKYVPELSSLRGKTVHEPVNPIVDHSRQSSKALALYQAVR